MFYSFLVDNEIAPRRNLSGLFVCVFDYQQIIASTGHLACMKSIWSLSKSNAITSYKYMSLCPYSISQHLKACAWVKCVKNDMANLYTRIAQSQTRFFCFVFVLFVSVYFFFLGVKICVHSILKNNIIYIDETRSHMYTHVNDTRWSII